MPHDLGLLLNPVANKRPPGFVGVAVSAEGMSHQEEVPPAPSLTLPDVGHFVDEEALEVERRGGEVGRPERSVGMEIDIAVRRHGDVAGLQGPPSAADDADARIVDRVAEDGAGEGASGRDGAD